MSSPENTLDPQPINPPDNTTQDPSTDTTVTDEEANLGFTDTDPTPPPPINPPDNT